MAVNSPPLNVVAQPEPLPTSFDSKYLQHDFTPTIRQLGVGNWTLERVRSARDSHMIGNYRESALLAEATKTDPAVYAALFNRLAPHRGLPIDYSGPKVRILEDARKVAPSIAPPEVVADHFEWLAQLGEAVGHLSWRVAPDASRMIPLLSLWPMASLYHDRYSRRLLAQTTEGLVEVKHGDGKWIVMRLNATEPWQWGAIKPVGETWADRRFGVRDRSQNAETHGIGHAIGELPEDVPLDSNEGKAVQKLVVTLRQARSGGVVPHGTIIKMLESMGAGWQIFRELIDSDSKDIARAYLGSEASMVGEGGNYIKAAQLFGVRNDIVEGDLGAAAKALNTGIWRVYSLHNFGLEDVITQKWMMPDPDEDARRESLAMRTDAFNRAIDGYRKNGGKITQDFAKRLGEKFGVDVPEFGEPPPAAAATPPATPPPSNNAPAAA